MQILALAESLKKYFSENAKQPFNVAFGTKSLKW